MDLVDAHLKVRLLDNLKFESFEDVLPKLLKYFSKNKEVDWSKPNYRITYNNIKIFEIIGFAIKLNKIKDKTKAEIKLKYENNDIKISARILIKLQDFFQYKVVEYLKKESETNEKIKHFFNRRFLIDNNEFEVSTDDIRYNVKENSDSESESEITLIDNKELAIEEWNYCDYNNYRVDMLLHISGKYYLCLEFFENHHKNPNEVDLSNELHRIMSLVYNNKSRTKKIIHVGIFWESDINNETKFNKFMKEVVIDKIEKYYNIDNEKEYIINAISEELGCEKEVAEVLYDATENWNKAVIPLKLIDEIVNWKKGKEEESKTKILNKFIKKINQFKEFQNDNKILDNQEDIDIQEDILELTGGTFNDDEKKIDDNEKIYYDNKTDCLTNYGFTLYISYLITSNVLNSPKDEEDWNEFNAKITRGFIKGLKKIRNDSLMLTDNFMTGLWDCY